jgi:GAF domain-containing protein
MVANRIVGGLSAEDGLVAAIQTVESDCGATSVTMYLVEAGGTVGRRRLSTASVDGPGWEAYDPGSVAPDTAVALVLRTGQPVMVADPLSEVDACTCVRDHPRVVVTVPVVGDLGVVGAIHVHWRYRRIDVSEDIRAISSVASLCAIAVQNARLHECEVEAARLDGVRLAARTAIDDVGNDIAAIRWLADIAYRQLKRGDPVDPEVLKTIVDGAAGCLDRMRQMVEVSRVETCERNNLPPTLDLAHGRSPALPVPSSSGDGQETARPPD